MSIESDIEKCYLDYGYPSYLEDGNIECKKRSSSQLIEACKLKKGTIVLDNNGEFINCILYNYKIIPHAPSTIQLMELPVDPTLPAIRPTYNYREIPIPANPKPQPMELVDPTLQTPQSTYNYREIPYDIFTIQLMELPVDPTLQTIIYQSRYYNYKIIPHDRSTIQLMELPVDPTLQTTIYQATPIIFRPNPIPFNNIVTIPQTVKEANDETTKKETTANAETVTTIATEIINTGKVPTTKIDETKKKNPTLSLNKSTNQTGRMALTDMEVYRETHTDKKTYPVRLKIEALNAYKLVKAAYRKFIGSNPSLPDLEVADSYRNFDAQYAAFDWNFYEGTGGNTADRNKVKEGQKLPMPRTIKPAGTYEINGIDYTFKKDTKWPLLRKIGTNGKIPIAFPGTSNHGSGITIDIDQNNKQAMDWMRVNGTKYGWSWTEGSSIGEPWHFNYLPNDKRIYSKEGKLLEVKNTTIVPIINSK